MTSSKCPSCGLSFFKVEVLRPDGCLNDICFVRCRSCGVAVGVLQDRDSVIVMEKEFKKQNEAIKLIAEKLNVCVDLD